VDRFTQSGKKVRPLGHESGDKKLRRPNRFLTAIAISLLFAVSAIAEAPASVAKFAAKGFPDNSDLRGRLFAYVIGASKDVALNYGEKKLQSAAGPVTVRVQKRSSDFFVEFLNASASGSGEAGRGSCFIQRGNAKGNYILQARILLEDDPSCYLTLYPSGSGTRGDIVMYGAVVKKGLYLSDMIYRILLLSFSDIVDATSRSFDWSTVFKFGSRTASANVAGELRAELASLPPPAEQSAIASAPASAASIALGSVSSKFALAAAPTLPSPGGQDLGSSDSGSGEAAAKESGGPMSRSLKILYSIDRASSPEALILDLASSGDSTAKEISIAADSLPAFVDERGDPLAKPAYADFPRYDSKGLPFGALRAAMFIDLQSNLGSAYALVGEGLRAMVLPSYDDAGRLSFAVFSGGRESSWDELSGIKRDMKARVLRIQQ
jgi:hypothetical protein